jgi:hypothetical protein
MRASFFSASEIIYAADLFSRWTDILPNFTRRRL